MRRLKAKQDKCNFIDILTILRVVDGQLASQSECRAGVKSFLHPIIQLYSRTKYRQHVLLLPLVAGAVQASVLVRRRVEPVGSAVDGAAVPQLPPARVCGPAGLSARRDRGEQVWLHGGAQGASAVQW